MKLLQVDASPRRDSVSRQLTAHFAANWKKRFPQGTAAPADMGKLLSLRLGLRHERMVAEWCEEAVTALSELASASGVALLDTDRRERTGSDD